MAKPLTNLQHAAQMVIEAFNDPQTDQSLENAIDWLNQTLQGERSKPVGRPRTRAHDAANPKCSCVECRKMRKEARKKHTFPAEHCKACRKLYTSCDCTPKVSA